MNPEPAAPTPAGMLEQTLQQLPAAAQQRLRPHLQTLATQRCALEQRRYPSGSSIWRIRFRMAGLDGRNQQVSIAIGPDETAARRLHYALRLNRQKKPFRRRKRRQPRPPAQDLNKPAREARQRRRDLRSRFFGMARVNRDARAAAWKQLLADGLVEADPTCAQARLYSTAENLKAQQRGCPRGRRRTLAQRNSNRNNFFGAAAFFEKQNVPALLQALRGCMQGNG
ncbi:MAG: hypothetical protein NTV49_07825 [Kiritimatiellaeota bacterium]|nr:hypothetical protein [Kiritimatiellota bacterium]